MWNVYLLLLDLAGKSFDDHARVIQIMLDTEDFQLPAVNFFFEENEETKVCCLLNLSCFSYFLPSTNQMMEFE